MDDSQPLIRFNSLNSNDQINTGAGHDISHNKDKRPSVEDDKSRSSDQSSNDSDSDNDDVGATPSRGKMQRFCCIYDKELYLQQRIGAAKLPMLQPNTSPQLNLILTMMMLELNLPEVKMERVC